MHQILPGDAYLSSQWFDLEQENLFGRNWQFAAFRSDFPEIGDYKTVNAGSFSLFVIKDKQGQLSAFHNICRHRGIEILEGKGRCLSKIVCPYHKWSYGLDGTLQGVPDENVCFPDLKKDDFGLKRASIGVLGELVFVHPDSDEDFERSFNGLVQHLWPHEIANLPEGEKLTYELEANWKVFVENALDGYHLKYLHANTLGGPAVGQNEWARFGTHMIWYAKDGEAGQKYALPAKARSEFATAGIQPLIDSSSVYGGVYYIYPNLLVTPSPYNFAVTKLVPVTPEQTRLVVWSWPKETGWFDAKSNIPGYDANTDVISSKNWTKHPLETGDFMSEDIWICEKMQRGLHSPAWENGPMARGEGGEQAAYWFQEQVASSLELEQKSPHNF